MTTETPLQNQLRVAASQRGGYLWRNNNGALQDSTGRWVRYGLANDSAQINKVIKSSDLIGIMPRLIVAEDVGTVIGQFYAVEAKRPGWGFTYSDEHAVAQWRYHELIRAAGGVAMFATKLEDFRK